MIAKVLDRHKESTLEQNNVFCTEEEWNGLIKAKEDFLAKGVDPRLSPYVSPELAESWIRSHNYGVDPNVTFNPPILSPTEVAESIKANELLIEVTRSVLKPFCQTASPTGYQIGLQDRDGVLIFLESKNLPDNKKNKYRIGMIYQEKTIGTNVYSLCKRYEKPMQLLSPQVYAKTDEYDIVSAANIADENGNLLGILVYHQSNKQLTENPWLKDYQDLRQQTLGLITALAQSIETQLKLKKSYEQLEISHKMLKATFNFVGQGIAMIDPNGNIMNLNKEAKRMLRLPTHLGVNISQYLSHDSKIMSFVKNRASIDYYDEVLYYPDGSSQSFLIDISTITNAASDQVEAAVLRLSDTKKMNAFAAKRVGANASYNFINIIGDSKVMLKTKNMAQRFSVLSENVLLLGENGTGKELFAQSIHNMYRPNQPFIALNCAAIPRNLIESELFGYEGGSFTGADRHGRPGKIELANKGTLFLDEIGDMPYEIQAVLLRILQDKQVMRIGGKQYQPVDFRIIASTNQNLKNKISEKLFREDLYYRLSVLTFEIPPLRDRDYDIIKLAEHFIASYAYRMSLPVPIIDNEVKKSLMEYDWPGNVRQLENAMIYAFNMSENGYISLNNLPIDIVQSSRTFSSDSNSDEKRKCLPNDKFQGKEMVKNLEKEVLQNVLSETKNNITKAANIMGISRSSMYRKLKTHNIDF